MWNLAASAAALLLLIPAMLSATRLAGEYAGDAAVCHQLSTTAALRDAAVSYVVANGASLGIATGATATLAPATLVTAGELSSSWQDLGPYDTTHAVRVHNNGNGYDVLTLTHGGNQLDERRLRASASCAAQGVSYVDTDSPSEIISASQGERVAASTFDSGATPIEPGRLMFLDHVGAGQVVPPYLHRYDVPGTDANRMFTAIDMSGNDVDGAGTVTASTVDTDKLNAGTANVAGDATIGGNATITGLLSGSDAQFTGNVYATNVWHLSDRNEKTDIKDIVCRPAADLRLLLPKEYRWKSNGERKISYIAQDVEAIVPEFVRRDPKGRLVVMQSELNLYLMRCLLGPALHIAAAPTLKPAPKACPPVSLTVVGTRAPGKSRVYSWPTFEVDLPRQASGTGDWAPVSGDTMRQHCLRFWSACNDGTRRNTCHHRDHSLASEPVFDITSKE